MTTTWEGFGVSLCMIVCHGLLQLAVLLIIAIYEEEMTTTTTHSDPTFHHGLCFFASVAAFRGVVYSPTIHHG